MNHWYKSDEYYDFHSMEQFHQLMSVFAFIDSDYYFIVEKDWLGIHAPSGFSRRIISRARNE